MNQTTNETINVLTTTTPETSILIYLAIAIAFFILSYVKNFELIGSLGVMVIGLFFMFELNMIISLLVMFTGFIKIFNS